MRAIAVIVVAVATTMACVGCSSSASPTSSSHGRSGADATRTASVAATTSTATATGGGGGGGGGISIAGAFTAKVTISLCTSGIGSIAVRVDGDSEKYLGSISARSFGFVGPAGADYTLKSGQAKPAVSADGTSFTVKGTELTDLVSGKTITATGTASCP